MTLTLDVDEVYMLRYLVRREGLELSKKRTQLILKFGGVADLRSVDNKLALVDRLRTSLGRLA